MLYEYKSGLMEKCTRNSDNSDQSLVYNLATIVGLTDKLKESMTTVSAPEQPERTSVLTRNHNWSAPWGATLKFYLSSQRMD